jgi:hypothetical protein
MEYSLHHLAGLAGYNADKSATAYIDESKRRIVFRSYPKNIYLNFEDIAGFSFDENYKRSAGKTAAGAIIGGIATGGIGLLVGGALGAKRKKDHTLYITYKTGSFEAQASFKGANIMGFYNDLVSSISKPEPEYFSRKAIVDYDNAPVIAPAQNESNTNGLGTGEIMAGLLLIFVLLIIISKCNNP